MNSHTDAGIETLACRLRHVLGLESVNAPCVALVLKNLPSLFPDFKIVRKIDDEMPSEQAWMDTEQCTLQVRETVYAAALSGDPRARFTIIHELGHLVLGHKGRFQRKVQDQKYDNASTRIKEAEANKFAAYFLAPTALAEGLSESELVERFQLSSQAAIIAKERIERDVRRRTGGARQLPASVVDFLLEAKARGKKLKTDLGDYDGV